MQTPPAKVQEDVLPRWQQVLSRTVVSRAVALILIAVPTLVLAGWALGIPLLTNFIPGVSGMNPMTALCFLLLGAAMILHTFGLERYAAFLGALVVAIGTLRVFELMGLGFLKIDLLLFSSAILAAPTPSHMAFLTALLFILAGLSVSTNQIVWLRTIRFAEITSLTTFLFALTALIGIAFQAGELLYTQLFFSVSVPTAVLFLLSAAVFYALARVEGERLSFGGQAIVSGVLMCAMTISIAATSFLEQDFHTQAREAFSKEVVRATEAINDRMSIYVNVLEGGRGVFAASSAVTRSEWRAYVDTINVQKNYPGIQGVGYAVFVTPQERTAFIQAVRKEGFPDFTIRPEGARELYSAIIYLEPFDVRNQEAFGYDMFSNAIRREAMEQARDTGEPSTTGPVTLVQEIDADVQHGFLVYVPVYENGAPTDTVAERQAAILGYVYSPFRMGNFIKGVLGAAGIPSIGLRIDDGVDIRSADTELYDDTATNAPRGGTGESFSAVKYLSIAGRTWTLTFTSVPGYGATLLSRVAPIVSTLIGLVFSMLITLVLYTLLTSRQKAVAYADKVTKDLRDAKAKDDAVLASIGDGLVVLDTEGHIVLVNAAFEQLLGWSEEEVRGKLLVDVVPMLDERKHQIAKENRLATKTLTKKAVTAAETTETLYYVRKDGSSFPVALTVSPIAAEEEFLGAVEVFRDITLEKQIDAAKSEFVSLASHQLRTPLSTVSWYTEALLDGDGGKLTKGQQGLVEQIRSSNTRMTNLVDALLNVSRIELGTFASNPITLDIRTIVDTVKGDLAPQIAGKKIIVNWERPAEPLTYKGDAQLLAIILQNLLSNAVKYTPEGGSVSLRIGQDSEELRIEVADTGYGIPDEEKERIFNKLFRASNVQKKDTDGTGLGLYIVKAILERQGGSITFDSILNKGTTFRVTLPASGMKRIEGTKALTRNA